MKTKKYIITSFIVLGTLLSSYGEENSASQNVIKKKYFKNNNTFIILCKGWPKKELTGQARIESAKEAALINAQFSSRQLFDSTIDVVKSGTILKYEFEGECAVIHYRIKSKNLKMHYRNK